MMNTIRAAFFFAIVACLVAHYSGITSINPSVDPVVPPGPDSSRRVLIVAETSPKPPYTKAQNEALSSAKLGYIRDWTDTNCGGFRSFDPSDPPTEQDKIWRAGFDSADKSKLPLVKTYSEKLLRGGGWSKDTPITDENDIKKAIGMK